MYLNILVIALALAELGAATAVPANGDNVFQKRSFSVKQAPCKGPRNVVRELKAVLSKHGMPIPEGLANADESKYDAPQMEDSHSHSHGMSNVNKRAPTPASSGSGTPVQSSGSGSVANTPEAADSAYLAPITIGGQQLTMDFDTGSSDLWVFSPALGGAGGGNHDMYDPQKSQTWKAMSGSSFKLNYAEGSSISGNMVGTDVVTIGGVSVPNQVVELPSTIAQKFMSEPIGGLVGLGPSSGNTVKPQPAKTFLDNIAPTLDEPVMGANLKHGQQGSYDFGKLDSSAFTGPMQWVSAQTDSGVWEFPSSQFAVGNGAPQTNSGGRPAIADTGTTLMVVDDVVAQAYWKQVQGAQMDQSTGMWSFPCNAQLPDLHVQLAGNSLSTIPGQYMNFQPLSGGSNQRRRFARRNNKNRRDILAGGTCQGALYGQPASQSGGAGGQSFQIYGDVMFKAQYVAFNPQNNSVGFAPHA